MSATDQIQNYPLFEGLSEAELASIAPRLVRRSFARGVHLFYPGNPSMNTYLIESGLVRLFFVDARGEEFLLNLIGPREVFGLPPLGKNQLRIIGAAAHQPSVILSISCQDLLSFMDRSPQFMRNAYQAVATSARQLAMHTRSLVTLGLYGRLAVLLLRLSMRPSETPDEITLPLSQAELATWVGASRGHLNRTVARMQQLGLIHVDGQKIVILDRPGLVRLSEEQATEQV